MIVGTCPSLMGEVLSPDFPLRTLDSHARDPEILINFTTSALLNIPEPSCMYPESVTLWFTPFPQSF